MSIRTPQQYKQAFISQKGGEQVQPGLFGRLLRGKREDDFRFLSPDEQRLIVMAVDHESLGGFLGQTRDQVMDALGWTDDLKQQARQGEIDLKLAVFSEAGLEAAPDKIVLAEWPNVLAFFEVLYPALREFDLAGFERELKALPVDENWYGAQRGDANYMDEQALIRVFSSSSTRAEKLVALRKFFMHVGYLNPLFAGDGFTREFLGGPQGVREYLLRNRAIADFPEAVLIDL